MRIAILLVFKLFRGNLNDLVQGILQCVSVFIIKWKVRKSANLDLFDSQVSSSLISKDLRRSLAGIWISFSLFLFSHLFDCFGTLSFRPFSIATFTWHEGMFFMTWGPSTHATSWTGVVQLIRIADWQGIDFLTKQLDVADKSFA